MYYLWLKNLHITCAVLSFAGFLLRGWWMARESPWLKHPLTRILPHVNDTLLLIAGVGLALALHQYPIAQSWLSAKLGALLLYIVLGSVALKRGHTLRVRLLALAGAILTFGYMVAVAVTRQPLPWPIG